MNLPPTPLCVDIWNFATKISYNIWFSVDKFDRFQDIYTQETRQCSEVKLPDVDTSPIETHNK